AVYVCGIFRRESVMDGVETGEDGDDRVRRVRQPGVERPDEGQRLRPLPGAGTAAGDADVAGDAGEQEDRAGVVLAVGVPLRSPALGDRARLGRGDLAGELADPAGRDAGDVGRPLRRLLHPVRAAALDVGAVGGVRRGALRQRVLVETDAVPVEEVLVLEVLRQHDV